MPSDPKSEDTNAVVKSIGDLMGITVTDNDISVSHRMPQSKRYKDKQRGPPAIIAKFTRRVTKDKFYEARPYTINLPWILVLQLGTPSTYLRV